jgi:hypothetical protein
MKNDMRVATHLPLLARAFEETQGPVVEFGTGYYSTTYLHWLCGIFNRKLLSVDSNYEWYTKMLDLKCDYHDIIIVDNYNYDLAPVDDTYWGLVFIDHSPALRRPVEAIRMKDNAEIIVLHDTEPRTFEGYGWGTMFPQFKYRYHYDKIKPWTSAVSNIKELKW